MKRYRYFSQALKTVTAHTDFTRSFLRETEYLSKAFIKSALLATDSNVKEAMKNLEPGAINVSEARKYFEDAIQMADIVYNDEEALAVLTDAEKKMLSVAYACSADFLRSTTHFEKYTEKGSVRDLVNKALSLDPKNAQAIGTDGDLRYNYRV